jgi:hypothetical protein
MSFHVLNFGRDEFLCETRVRVLHSAGFQAHTVSTLNGALMALDSCRFDLVILCHTLRDKTKAAADEISQRWPSLPMLTLRLALAPEELLDEVRIKLPASVPAPFIPQRRFGRFRLPVQARIAAAGEKASMTVPLLDISMGGFSALLPGEFNVGDLVRVYFAPASSGLPLQAAIRNASGNRYGLEFMPFDARAHAELRRVLPN